MVLQLYKHHKLYVAASFGGKVDQSCHNHVMEVWKQLENWTVVNRMNHGLCTYKNSFPTSCFEGRFNICQS